LKSFIKFSFKSLCKKIKTLGVDFLLHYYNHWNWHFSILEINCQQFCILNHSLHLSTYCFFPICCTILNDLKFFEHVANLPKRMNPKNYYHFGHIGCTYLIQKFFLYDLNVLEMTRRHVAWNLIMCSWLLPKWRFGPTFAKREYQIQINTSSGANSFCKVGT